MVAVWVIVLSFFLLNGFSAGVAAGVYLWREGKPRSDRVVTSVLATGFLLLLMFVPLIAQELSGSGDRVAMVIVGAVLFAAGAAVSVPGAVIMSRRIERGPSAGDVFR